MGNKSSKGYDVELKHCPPNPIKKHVCIIGGGSSALILMKELLALGHTVECFERLPRIGGVYVKSYQNTILTTSSLMTAWSDFSDGQEKDPKFWTAEEYLVYLEAFAKKYDLYKYISFLHDVKTVRKCNLTGKWIVTVKGGYGCKNIERCEDVPADPDVPSVTKTFDAVCVCAGTHNYSSLPNFPGQERFKGELVHSEHYHKPEDYAGKRVLIIGGGESGSDITNEISKFAAKTAVVIRGLHGHIIPRIQGNGRVTDLNTNRCRYSNPFIFGDAIGYVNQIAKKFVANFLDDKDLKNVLKKISELNMHQKTSAFSKTGCKNEGFVTAMVTRGTELHRDSFEIFENKVVFADGSEFECDAIVACTGFRNVFPFFDEYHPEIAYAGMNPRTHFKQSIYIEYPTEVAFFGFARPAFGSVPPTVEMQSRLFSLVLNGELELPSKETMRYIASEDQKNWETRFGYDARRVKGLVDFQIYCDGIAKTIGVFPPLSKLFFEKPNIWWKIMFGPFTVHQYRLVGPYANPKRAEEVYDRHPIGDFLESAITASFLLTAKVLSILGFERFTPNDF